MKNVFLFGETSLRETNEASTINMSRECRVPLMY